MKHIECYILLFVLFTGLFSCKKDKYITRVPSQNSASVYHVNLYDYKSGEKISGMEAELIGVHNFEGYYIGGHTIKSDVNGAFSFNPFWIHSYNNYLKVLTQNYVEVLYEVNEFSDTTILPVHAQEGSNGPNVVHARLLRKDGNGFHFKAYLYRKAPIDLHIRQVSDYSDTLAPIFNAAVYASDPSNHVNNFGINDVLGAGLQLNPEKKIDTTIRIYVFGDYLNKISWSVYENVFISFDQQNRKSFSAGQLEEKIFPSDTSSKITITF